MIPVDRSRVPPPPVFSSEWIGREMSRAEEFFSLPWEQRAQRQYRFDEKVWTEARRALMELFHRKCAFCESRVESSQHSSVEHFRPMSHAMGLDGTRMPDHYWWLAYSWENLYLACTLCNRHKASRFPVRNQRVPPMTLGEALREEEPLLLDPCGEDPCEHLVFTEQGLVVSDSERGRVTIEILGLNRENLVSQRKQVHSATTALLDMADDLRVALPDAGVPLPPPLEKLRRNLMNRMDSKAEFAAVARQIVSRWAEERGVAHWLDAGLAARSVSKEDEHRVHAKFTVEQTARETYSVETDGEATRAAFYSGAKRIERIEISNFRAIEQLNVEFPRPITDDESWLMLLGENGTGKSSILKAVGLALMGEAHANSLGLNASQFVRHGQPSGFVRVHLSNLSVPIELRFSSGSARFAVFPEDPKMLLLGYGATRLLRRAESPDADAGDRYIRVRNLFDPTAPLNDAEAWLTDEHQVSGHRFHEIALTLKDLLMLDDEDEFFRREGRVYLRHHSAEVNLEDLSDGFQSVVALATDIMITLFERWPSMKIAEGIVLLDEIEVHLHPSWKIAIVERLRRCFPRVAFLVTTHDPLCLKGLRQGEIAVLRRDLEGHIRADTELPPIEHLRADQILTSPLFGLATTRGTAVWNKADRYTTLYQLGERRTPEQEAEFRSLQTEMGQSYQRGETPLERQAEEILHASLFEGTPVSAGASVDADLDPAVRTELKARLNALLEL